MNKNLESEYQNMIRAEVPDIWDKIEAKIDAQEAQKKIVTFKKKTSKWKYYVVPAAAALICVAIAIPFIRNSREYGGTTAASTANYADTAVTEVYHEEAAVSEAETVYDEQADDEREERQKSSELSSLVNGFISGGTSKDQAAATADNSSMGDTVETAESENTEAYEEESFYAVYTVRVPVAVPGDVVEKIAESLDLMIEDQNENEGTYVLVSLYPVSAGRFVEIGRELEANEHIAEVDAKQR